MVYDRKKALTDPEISLKQIRQLLEIALVIKKTPYHTARGHSR